MINRFRALFDSLRQGETDGADFHDKHVAAAALLVEAAVMDGSLDGEEEAAMRAALGRQFGFDGEELDALMEEGRRQSDETNQLVAFTRAIKDGFDYDERVALMEMLWEVTYADGKLHHYEANLLRRIGGLIYVSDRDRGEARKRVMTRLGLQDEE